MEFNYTRSGQLTRESKLQILDQIKATVLHYQDLNKINQVYLCCELELIFKPNIFSDKAEKYCRNIFPEFYEIVDKYRTNEFRAIHHEQFKGHDFFTIRFKVLSDIRTRVYGKHPKCLKPKNK